jgi:hypothetical protein
MVAAMTVKSPTAIRLHRTDGQANKRMQQTVGALAEFVAPPAADAQRCPDMRG